MDGILSDFFPDLQAVILCGGLGKRLQGHLPGIPKSLAPIGGRAFLEYAIEDLLAAGIRNLVLCTGHGGEAIREHFWDGSAFGVAIRYSEEQESLGSGGVLKKAQRLIDSNPFLVMNADSLLELDYGRLLSKHLGERATVTLALAQVPDRVRYGNVMLLPNGEVLELMEKPQERSLHAEPAWVSGGVCAMDQAIFAKIPAAPPAVSLERDIFPKLAGHGLFAELFDGFLIDIGVPGDYERACNDIPQRYARVATHSR